MMCSVMKLRSLSLSMQSILNLNTYAFRKHYLPTSINSCIIPNLIHSTTLHANQITDPSKLTEKPEYDKLYQTVEVECRGNDTAVLKSYSKFVSLTAKHLELNLEEIKFPKHNIERWTLLKSVHVHKKHRVQYEVRTHFLIMKFRKLTSSTADTMLEYIQRNLPEGVSMKVSKVELSPLPKYVKNSEAAAPPAAE